MKCNYFHSYPCYRYTDNIILFQFSHVRQLFKFELLSTMSNSIISSNYSLYIQIHKNVRLGEIDCLILYIGRSSSYSRITDEMILDVHKDYPAKILSLVPSKRRCIGPMSLLHSLTRNVFVVNFDTLYFIALRCLLEDGFQFNFLFITLQFCLHTFLAYLSGHEWVKRKFDPT